MVRERVVIICLLSVIFLLTLGKIAVIEFLDQFNQTYYNDLQQIHSLNIQNSELKDKLLFDESYGEIASRAATMGYR